MTTALQIHTPAPAGAIAPLDKAGLKAQLARLEDPEMLELQNRLAAAYDNACRALIGPNDVQIEGKREFKKKSAWRKLGRHFGISTEIVRESLELLPEGEFIAKCVVRGLAPWGQTMDAAGACGSDEEKGNRTITMADAVATAQTRAVNRATSDLIAMGEVSAEEIAEGKKKRVDSEPELTLEGALEIEFPWKTPKKYAGRPLSEVSTRTLLMVSKWAKAKIEEGSTTKAVHQIYRAAVLITESRPDLEATIAAMEKGNDEPGEQAAEATASEGAEATSQSHSAPASATHASSAPLSANEADRLAAKVEATIAEVATTPTPEPTVEQPQAAAEAAAQATTSAEQEDPTKKSIRLTTRLHELLFSKSVATEVQTRVRQRLATTEVHDDALIESAIAELEAVEAPF